MSLHQQQHEQEQHEQEHEHEKGERAFWFCRYLEALEFLRRGHSPIFRDCQASEKQI